MKRQKHSKSKEFNIIKSIVAYENKAVCAREIIQFIENRIPVVKLLKYVFRDDQHDIKVDKECRCSWEAAARIKNKKFCLII
jgi:hypothetical protein